MKDENASLGPPPVVTIISYSPALRAGVIQVIVVLFTTLIDATDVTPNVTDVAPVKFVPVIVTVVPPAVLPINGEMSVMLAGII